MQIEEAQREVRTRLMGGFAGQLVSGALWLASAAVSTWGSRTAGMIVLFAGGFFIFPLTQLLIRLMGRSAKLSPENRLEHLGRQVAFTLPLTLPLVLAATLYDPNWFYPAFMIALGAHYLPFIFLYGMWQFGVLAGLLVGGGALLGLYGPDVFALGAWITGVVLVVFAVLGRSVVLSEERASAPAA